MNFFAGFIIVILIIIILWCLNNFIFKTNIIYDKMLDANISPNVSIPDPDNSPSNVIKSGAINANNTSNFMLSVWFYIDNWGNEIGNEKNILYLATSPNAQTVPELTSNLSGLSKKVSKNNATGSSYKNLNICLDKYENNLFVDIETYKQDNTDTETSNFTRYKIPNISVQKWNCLTLVVDSRTMDIYLDGKLINSFILNGLYKNYYGDSVNDKNLYLGNLNSVSGTSSTNIGFEGFITRIRFEPNPINPEQSYKIYREGIDQSLADSIFQKYSLEVSFLEYNKEVGGFKI